MDTLGKSKDERLHVKQLLRKKFGTLEAAADAVGLSKFTLSRALAGKQLELDTIVKILQGSGHLKTKKYRFPKEDFKTFCFLNGIMDFSLK